MIFRINIPLTPPSPDTSRAWPPGGHIGPPWTSMCLRARRWLNLIDQGTRIKEPLCPVLRRKVRSSRSLTPLVIHRSVESEGIVLTGKTFPHYFPFVRGIHWFVSGIHQWVPLTRGQWCGALMFSLLFAEKAADQSVELPVIWDVMKLAWDHCYYVMMLLWYILLTRFKI